MSGHSLLRDMRHKRIARIRDVAHEAVAALLSRSGRTVLMTVGTVVGVGAVAASIGLATTARAEVNGQFNALASNQLTVTQQLGPTDTATLPLDSEQLLDRLAGVVSAGLQWQVSLSTTGVTALPPALAESSSTNVAAEAATPGTFNALGASFSVGEPYGPYEEQRAYRVAVLGASAAHTLGISSLEANPTVYVDGVAFPVVAIMSESGSEPALLDDVLIPGTTANALWGPPQNGSVVLIKTQPGASGVITDEAPLALEPTAPQSLLVIGSSQNLAIQTQINDDLSGLVGLIGLVALAIGVLGTGALTLMSVIERTSEIGLRRALGARRFDIGVQFIFESSATGTVGGVLGTIMALISIAALAQLHHQVPVISLAPMLPDPLIGTASGFIAGLYPALRAAFREPVEALRR